MNESLDTYNEESTPSENNRKSNVSERERECMCVRVHSIVGVPNGGSGRVLVCYSENRRHAKLRRRQCVSVQLEGVTNRVDELSTWCKLL